MLRLLASFLLIVGQPGMSLAEDTGLTQNITVAEWRAMWTESGRVAYAIGAMNAVDGWIEEICPVGSKPRFYTVAELNVYLGQTAEPDWKMPRALWTFWSRQCR